MTENDKDNKEIKQEEAQVEQQRKYFQLDFAKLAKSIVSDLGSNNSGNILFTTFPKERVMRALQNPKTNISELRDISNFLYILSPHYKRLTNYYAEMLTLDWYISPYKFRQVEVDAEKFREAYEETLDELDTMNIKHEMLKALQVVYREGIFFGYEYKEDDSYFIQRLDSDMCEISSIEDGVFNFSFNFQYFEGDEEKLENFAPEFTTKFKAYQNAAGKRGKDAEDLTWQELDSENTICLKADETVLYPFPPFVGVFPEVYELQDYKALKKANNEMQNIALLSGKIPMKKNSNVSNDFSLTLDTALEFGKKMNMELPDQMGFILSVFDELEMFKLSDDKVGTDKVEEAVGSFWDSSGVSRNLFTDGGTTDAAVRASLITDEQSVFVVLRQIERWINRKLKFRDGRYNFQIHMLNTTWQNRKEKAAEELKLAQYGIPNIIRLCATSGMSQAEIESMNYLEMDVLGLGDNLIPLQSSHTSNGKDDANAVTGKEKGRPSNEEDNIRTDGE